MKSATYQIPNISCGHCLHTIQMELSEMPGVLGVEGSIESKQVTIIYESPATEAQIVDCLTEINYPPAK
jgi:copper chaperone